MGTNHTKIVLKTGQDGFTILEVMVAMVIIGVSLLLLLNMGMVALDGNDWANQTTRATQLMQEKLESLRSSGDQMESGRDTVAGITRNWTVSNVGDFLKRVDVTVEWEDIRSSIHADTMTAFVRCDSL